MVKYVKLFHQFQKFISRYHSQFVDPYEKKLLNLICKHFDKIAEVGTAQGNRARLLTSLIQDEGESISSELCIQTIDDNPEKKSYPFIRIHQLTVGPFRGFHDEKNLKFGDPYSFIYGPNGSGKSSLCEALEYALLGYINEAIERKIETDHYIPHRANRGKPTVGKPKAILQGIDSNGELTEIKKNPLYNFFFIEKNRIENFSRITANSLADKKNLLAELFGLDEFNEFVNNFTPNFEEYIDVKGEKTIELAQKSSSIETHQKHIQNYKNDLAGIAAEKTNLTSELSELQLNIPWENLLPRIEERIAHIEKEKNYRIPDEITHETTDILETHLARTEDKYAHFEKENKACSLAKDKIKFRNLFDLVLQLEPNSKDKCPVCDTPVEKAEKNPYEKAKVELSQLSEVASLEINKENAEKDLHDELLKIKTFFINRDAPAKKVSSASSSYFLIKESSGEFQLLLEEYKKFKEQYPLSIRQECIKLDESIEQYNVNVRDQNKKRERLNAEQEKLREIRDKIKDLTSREQTLKEGLEKTESEIEKFNKENKELIQEAEKEKEIVERNKSYAEAYKSFLKTLKEYRDKLPAEHLENLNTLTLELYNAINRHDKDSEKAASISLPARPDDIISISFLDDPERERDALLLLSEGHIRCLGLSILLAKNIIEDCPVVIFDDIVNAIDDDHRGGVREVLLENDRLKRKQIILTTHAELFIEELENHCTHQQHKEHVKTFRFTKETDIEIGYNGYNYLAAARTCLNGARWRETLRNSRLALENIKDRLWNKLSNMDFKTEFQVTIRSPRAKPDLMSVIASMNSFIKERAKDDDFFRQVTPIFDYLVGINNSSHVIWNYLNRGSHDEEGRIEVDQLIVKDLVGKIEELDSIVKKQNNRCKTKKEKKECLEIK